MARRAAWQIAFIVIAGFTAVPSTTHAVAQWQRHELELKTPVRYDAGNGNPYRDLQLQVYWSTTPRTTDPAAPSGFGFWDGTRVENGQTFNIFKIRTALPQGTYYLWYKCSGTTGGLNCGSDPVLNRTATASVSFVVTANNRPGNLLYTNGFLQVTPGERFLKYAGNPTQRFYWQGDTAWPAFAREGQAMMAQRASNPNLAPGTVTSTWQAYIDNRAKQNYSVIQVTPAVSWQPRNSSEPKKAGCKVAEKSLVVESSIAPYPGPETFAFEQLSIAGCVGAVPNNCSRWRPGYWREVDAMVEYANSKGIVIAVTGAADPSDRGHCRRSQSYPTKEDSVIFARNLAARLAGNHVIYSINFDDWPDAVLDYDGRWPGTVHDTTLLVGPELKRAAPRHLVSNHMAGSASVEVYTRYHNQPWLNFHLYQSGHSLNLNISCPDLAGSAWQSKQKCAIGRALDITKTLRALSPAKPVINGEGPYEIPERQDALPPDNRYGMRHAAHVSLLTGAAGFTAGVHGEDPPRSATDEASIIAWDNPLRVLNSDGIKDMRGINRLLMSLYPGGTTDWGEFTRADGILQDTNSSSTAERRIAAGSQGNNYVAYIPNSKAVQTTRNLRTFDCRNWTVYWRSPRDNKTYSLCPAKQTVTSFERPENCPNLLVADQDGTCDWVLVLQRPKSSSPEALAGPYIASSLVESYVDDEFLTGGGDRIVSRLMSSEDVPLAPEATLSPSEEAFYGLPATVREPLSGVSWVVWESEGVSNGESTDVLARRVGFDGSPLGDAFRINQQTAYRQYAPFTVLDAAGNVTIVWASIVDQENPEEPKADIFARRFRADGTPLGDEFLVNTLTGKNQESPVAGADAAGNLVVGWVSRKRDISVRLFSSSGVPASGEILVNPPLDGGIIASNVEWSDLVEIVVDPLGDFVVRWNEYSLQDELTGWYAREFAANGQPLTDAYVEEP